MAMTPAQVKFYRAASADRLRAVIMENFRAGSLVTLNYPRGAAPAPETMAADCRAVRARARQAFPGLDYVMLSDTTGPGPHAVKLIIAADAAAGRRIADGWKRGAAFVSTLDAKGIESAANAFHAAVISPVPFSGHRWKTSRGITTDHKPNRRISP